MCLAGEFGGPLGRLFGLFMSKSLRRDLTDELSAIRAAAEALHQAH